MHSSLIIQEIIIEILGNMTRHHDLLCCILTCKAWFIPGAEKLWKNLPYDGAAALKCLMETLSPLALDEDQQHWVCTLLVNKVAASQLFPFRALQASQQRVV
jgi:hypothetical protein